MSRAIAVWLVVGGIAYTGLLLAIVEIMFWRRPARTIATGKGLNRAEREWIEAAL